MLQLNSNQYQLFNPLSALGFGSCLVRLCIISLYVGDQFIDEFKVFICKGKQGAMSWGRGGGVEKSTPSSTTQQRGCDLKQPCWEV